MRILLTNDDGIHAPGLRALYDAVKPLGEVFVFAPATEQSGVAHSITLHTPLRVRAFRDENGFRGTAVGGTPVDCVRIAVKELVVPSPDVVISGINLGANEGLNAFYSGTVAGALEGALLGVPSLAVSLVSSDSPDLKAAAQWALKALEVLMQLQGPGTPVLSVNIPAMPPERIKGLHVTRQGQRGADEGYDHRTDLRGEPYYWIRPDTDRSRAELGDDVHALHEGYVTLTPLCMDLTDHGRIDELRGVVKRVADATDERGRPR